MIEPSWDYFFYYGEGAIEEKEENEYDIIQGIMQPKKSLFYFRREGAGITSIENYPNSFVLSLLIRFDIVKWFSFRNSYISTNNINRQLAVSQDTINIQQENNTIDIDILYRNVTNNQEIQPMKVLV